MIAKTVTITALDELLWIYWAEVTRIQAGSLQIVIVRDTARDVTTDGEPRAMQMQIKDMTLM